MATHEQTPTSPQQPHGASQQSVQAFLTAGKTGSISRPFRKIIMFNWMEKGQNSQLRRTEGKQSGFIKVCTENETKQTKHCNMRKNFALPSRG